MAETYLVTGTSGNVGKHVIKHLLARGQKVIGTYHSSTGTIDHENLTYRKFDFTEPETWDPCLEKVNKVFLMRPPHLSRIRRDMYPFLAYLKTKEIQQIVFLSVQGAETNSFVPHHTIEKLMKSLGLPYTFIRPSFFMQNLTTTHLREIRDEQIVCVPSGKGKTNFIDTEDIGEIISCVFSDEKHLHKAYTVTGETSYCYQEVVDLLTSGLERKIEFLNPNPFRFIVFHLRRGRTLGMTLVMLALYSVVKIGHGDITTTTAEEILGRKPGTLEEFIRSNRCVLGGSVC